MIISINSWSWGALAIRLVIDLGELLKVALKVRGSRKRGA
jgi:hypothetical protein